MAYSLGQASGGWTESSSALRILNVGIRNTLSVLTDDAFTQANPCGVTDAATISSQVDTTAVGVLSGSVAFARPDAGSDAQYVGGPGSDATQDGLTYDQFIGYRPLGLFINSANGNAFENQPGVASGVGPFVCGGGTYGCSLYETQAIGANSLATAIVAGDDLVYTVGMPLVASRNGFLMPGLLDNGTAINHVDLFTTAFTAEQRARTGFVTITSAANLLTNITLGGLSTVVGVLRIAPDSATSELTLDLRI